MWNRTSMTERHLMKRGLKSTLILLYPQKSNIAEVIGSLRTSILASPEVRRQVEFFCLDPTIILPYFSQFHYYNFYRHKTDDEDRCPWLLRSPKTETYDLLEVQGKWEIWVGAISQMEVTVVCNKCSSNSDCNLNGVCNESSECECKVEDGVRFLGKPFVTWCLLLQSCPSLKVSFLFPFPKAPIAR
jgi:hypothetical protein